MTLPWPNKADALPEPLPPSLSQLPSGVEPNPKFVSYASALTIRRSIVISSVHYQQKMRHLRGSFAAALLLILFAPILIYINYAGMTTSVVPMTEDSQQTPQGSEWVAHPDPEIQRALIYANTFSCEFCPQFKSLQPSEDRSTRENCKSHVAINLEPPRPNSLTGPRKIPIKKGGKSLISIAVGEAGKENVRQIVRHFGLKDFAYLFFVYDASDWRNETFYDQAVFISAQGQMKWWYIKRFITPQLARNYEFIFAIDEDMDPKYIGVEGLIMILRTHKIQLAQPAMMPGNVNHDITRIVQHSDKGIVGRWTDFVECGPFVIFSSEAYDKCIWDLIQEDLTSGWGLDFLWHNYCKEVAGIDRTAIIDQHPQVHLSLKTASKLDSTKKTFEPYAEMVEYRRRFPNIKETKRKVFGMIRYIDLENQGEPHKDWDP